MSKVLVIVAYVFSCFKWGDWRNWRYYYPTILFVIIGDQAYNFVFYQFDLWRYNQIINHTFCDILVALTVFPSIIILYNTHYPKTFLKKSSYIILWTCFNAIIEYLLHIFGYISYHNGWNIFWSAGLIFIAFVLIRLHLSRPLLTWVVSLGFGLLTMLIFGLRFDLIK